MSWPPGQIPIIITGQYFDAAHDPLTGSVTFELTMPLSDPEDSQFVRAAPVTGEIGLVSPGVMSVQVACNDSPGLVPAGSLYKVTERVDRMPVQVSYYSLSRQLGASADLSTLTPVTPP